MIKVVDFEGLYQSPSVLVIGFKFEGILCISNNIPDWEENDDIL
jgi:hypothetical protein